MQKISTLRRRACYNDPMIQIHDAYGSVKLLLGIALVLIPSVMVLRRGIKYRRKAAVIGSGIIIAILAAVIVDSASELSEALSYLFKDPIDAIEAIIILAVIYFIARVIIRRMFRENR